MSPITGHRQGNPDLLTGAEDKAASARHDPLSSDQESAILTKVVGQQVRVNSLLAQSRLQARLNRSTAEYQTSGSLEAHPPRGLATMSSRHADKTCEVEMQDVASESPAQVTSHIVASSSNSSIEALTTNLPTNAVAFEKYVSAKIIPRLQILMLRCQVNSNGQFMKVPLDDDEQTELVSYCKAFAGAPQLSGDGQKKLKLKNLLSVILNRVPTRRVKVPAEAAIAAEMAFNRFEAEQWGGHVEGETKPLPTASGGGTGRVGRKSGGSEIARRKSSQGVHHPVGATTLLPPANHAIYGTRGIMRGILVKKDKKFTCSLDRRFPQVNFRVSGNNNLQIGQWWPRQICALRDGAHGSVGGGMSGSPNDGTWSVVLNSCYEETDRDHGEVIWYSMPKSTTNKNPAMYESANEVEAMRHTWAYNRPIRVIRGKGAGWAGAPCVGLRYDGLYHITDEERPTNSKGGLYIRFKLERLPGQGPLNAVCTRPSSIEINHETRVTDGYN